MENFILQLNYNYLSIGNKQGVQGKNSCLKLISVETITKLITSE